MTVPTYNWTCFRCKVSNPSGTEKCQACGFAASPTRAEFKSLRPPQPEDQTVGSGLKITGSDVWLFFPEALIAVFMLLISPFWAISLVGEGRYLAAAVDIIGLSVSCYGFYQGLLLKSKSIAYSAIAGILCVSYVAHILATT